MMPVLKGTKKDSYKTVVGVTIDSYYLFNSKYDVSTRLYYTACMSLADYLIGSRKYLEDIVRVYINNPRTPNLPIQIMAHVKVRDVVASYGTAQDIVRYRRAFTDLLWRGLVERYGVLLPNSDSSKQEWKIIHRVVKENGNNKPRV